VVARLGQRLCLSKNPSDIKVGQLFESDARDSMIKEAADGYRGSAAIDDYMAPRVRARAALHLP
jgi:hypothetical protein